MLTDMVNVTLPICHRVGLRKTFRTPKDYSRHFFFCLCPLKDFGSEYSTVGPN